METNRDENLPSRLNNWDMGKTMYNRLSAIAFGAVSGLMLATAYESFNEGDTSAGFLASALGAVSVYMATKDMQVANLRESQSRQVHDNSVK